MAQPLATTRIWPELLPELVEHIAKCLTDNERACTLRCVNKAAASQFRGAEHTTVHLSQPVPHHVFTLQWGPGTDPVDGAGPAMRQLSRKQRLELLCLTASSGCVENLEFALEHVGFGVWDRYAKAGLARSAAAAGKLEVCRWLRQRGILEDNDAAALSAAAEAGHQEVCEWLLDTIGFSSTSGATVAAARGGHVGLLRWLLQRLGRRLSSLEVAEAAGGCDLASLQQLYAEWREQAAASQRTAPEDEQGATPQALTPEVWGIRFPRRGGTAFKSAACSPTPDWRAKVEWLEELNCRSNLYTAAAVASRPDAAERLAWLRQRGCRIGPDAFAPAITFGCSSTVSYLLGEGVRPIPQVVGAAARLGRVEVLELLLRRSDCFEGPNRAVAVSALVSRAAGAGQPMVFTWAEGAGLLDRMQLSTGLLYSAARTGSVELMAWPCARGCPWRPSSYAAAAAVAWGYLSEWFVALPRNLVTTTCNMLVCSFVP